MNHLDTAPWAAVAFASLGGILLLWSAAVLLLCSAAIAMLIVAGGAP
jgi:hypothetical protein